MELEDASIESGDTDTVNGVDRILVGAGVLALLLLPAYGMLIVKPERYASKLVPGRGSDVSDNFPGPGLFFVGSVLFVLVIGMMVLSGLEPPNDDTVATAKRTGPGFAVGASIDQLILALQTRLFSGDFWSAVAVAVPIFAFSVSLAVPLRILLGWAVKGWTSTHAIGAALYITGGLLIGFTASATLGTLLGRFVSSTVGSLTGVLCILAVIGLTGVQAYGFGQRLGAKSEARLGVVAAAVPLSVIAVIAVWAFVANQLY
jgi:hypothetical protein